MRKLILSIIALTLSAGLWAETQSVNYIDADGQQKTVTATVVTNETGTLSDGWYVVLGEVSRGTITCNGDVHLILADGAKLTATGGEDQAGITVSGSNSLTIYGQIAQSGQLFARGGKYGAGIGGGKGFSGSNITINGGTVTANGGIFGAGIGGGDNGSGYNITINAGKVTANGGNGGAGIGGGAYVSGSNITINGGMIDAKGGEYGGAGIGGGDKGSGSNIMVGTALAIYADNNDPPTTEILHASDYDISLYLNGKRYALVKDVTTSIKESAIAAIDAAISESDNDHIIAIATNAKTAINAAVSIEVINALKTQALAAIASAKMARSSVLGPLGEEKAGTAVKVTKGDKEVILYAPDKVEYIIRK